MYLFIHIARTAGTTFSNILRKNFKEKYLRLYESKKFDFFNEEEIKSLATFFPFAQCVSSHDFSCPLPQPDKETKVVFEPIVFLRDPVERSLSDYFFQRGRSKLGIKKAFADLPYEEYFEKLKEVGYKLSGGKWSPHINIQTYILDRNYDVEAAKRRMREEFFFVGTVERFDESLLILKKKFAERGINFKIGYFKHNASEKRKLAKEILSPEIYQKVSEANKKDKELWSYANYLLDQEIEKYGKGFNDDLKKFKRKIKILGLFAGPMIFLERFVRKAREIFDKWFVYPLGIYPSRGID